MTADCVDCVNYEEKAKELRRTIMGMLYEGHSSFGGGSMSCIDVLTVLFHGVMKINKDDPYNEKRDMFFLSKGHCSSALYATLSSVGLIDKEELKTYAKNGSTMFIHPKKGTYKGVEASSGSLGHGLPIATGSALGAKAMGYDSRVFVLMGDGECNEGSIWENAAFASANNLNNLTVIVDRNGLQGCGRDSEILKYGDIAKKFDAFGFNAVDINGHDYNEIESALKNAYYNKTNKPTAIIAHTIKGKGISYMEDKLEWHYKSPSVEQYRQALEELR